MKCIDGEAEASGLGVIVL